MMPRPPCPIRFPYTTLFRSNEVAPRELLVAVGERESVRGAQQQNRAVVRRRAHAAEDRKSTRLNSSHVSISYAVFCLKKKKLVRQVHLAPNKLSPYYHTSRN